MATALNDREILAALNGGETADVLANRLGVPLCDLVPRLNRLRDHGQLRRATPNENHPVAQWHLTRERPSFEEAA